MLLLHMKQAKRNLFLFDSYHQQLIHKLTMKTLALHKCTMRTLVDGLRLKPEKRKFHCSLFPLQKV